MEIGKLLLLGAAGYLGYRYFVNPQATISSAAPGIGPGTTPPVSQPSPATSLTTRSMVQQAATKAGFNFGSADQWNYYYSQVRGVPGPDPGSLPDRSLNMNFDEWYSWASQNGLSGIVPMSLGFRGLTGRGAGYIRTDRLAVMEAE